MQRNQMITQSLLTEDSDRSKKGKQYIELRNRCKRAEVGGSSSLQYILFSWVHPLLTYGNKNTVEVDLMPKLSQKQHTKNELSRFQNTWNNLERSQKQGRTLMKALFKAYSREWSILLTLCFLQGALCSRTPILTALCINYLSNQRGNISYGIILFLVLTITNFIYRLILSQCFYRHINMGVKLANVVTMAIYNKSLKYCPLSDKQFTQAEIINYSQVDAQKLTYIGNHFAAFFYGPVQIIAGLIILYISIDIAFFSVIGIVAVLLVIGYFLSKINIRLNGSLLKAKDQRMKATQEMLEVIRYIKIAAIQKFFYRKVNNKRDQQIKWNLKKGYNMVIIYGVYWFTCPMLIAGAYLTYTLSGYRITAEVAFTIMTVVSLFQYPMFSLPNALSQAIQIFASLKRIQKFLFAKQIDRSHIEYLDKKDKWAIEISDGNFYWKSQTKEDQKQDADNQGLQTNKNFKERQQPSINQKSNLQQIVQQGSQSRDPKLQNFKEKTPQGKPCYIHALKDLNMKIEKGSFTMVVGDIGSGKSSLLLAILNQLISAQTSKLAISGTIAYSPQKPWIMSRNIKENIIFSSPFDDEKLKKVIHYACLQQDMKTLSNGLLTQIGEKGVNLSGGQKTRVSLARALYSQKDIYLLDDILSAVDVHVGEFILRETIKTFLRGRTILMPTHAIKFAPFADEIIVMKKGKIVLKGNYKDICNTLEYTEVTLRQMEKEKTQSNIQKEQEKIQDQFRMINQVINHKKGQKTSNDKEINLQIVEQLILPEDHKEGKIQSKVLLQFIRLCGGFFNFLFIILLTNLLYMACRAFSSIVVQIWCKNPQEDQSYLYYFMGLNGLAIAFIFVANTVLAVAAAKQGTVAHHSMIKGLLYAGLSDFYNRVPKGRILNRLTKDLNQLDSTIMQSFQQLLMNVFQMIGTLAICIYTTTPFALIPIIAVTYFANKIRKYYLKTQRQVSRYQKSTNSPVVTGFLSTISGLSTIRAYKKQFQFAETQLKYFDQNKKVRLTRSGLENWLVNILTYLSFFVSLPCIGYCMFSTENDPATMGLLLTYALSLSSNIVWLILAEADFQIKLVSLQRIYKFMNIQPEKNYIQYCNNWNSQEEGGRQVIKKGDIQFQDLKVRYRKDLPDVIKGITCKIQPGEKIGIVGRTGAGKTTIINTLLGVTQIQSGSILLDGQSIQSYSSKDLRHSITMIDQEPTLIKSTFRENLDFTGKYSDQQLQQTLRQCNLLDVIRQKGGLDGNVSNNSLSAGQKQLLCICRAFLKHSRIVLIDEATANIDVRNDATIQTVIAEKFKQSTVLTIAHRLSTLKNADKIMVMEKGVLVEFGSPKELQNKEGGVFSEMMKKNQKEMLV